MVSHFSEAPRMFMSLIENIQDAIVLLDANGKVMFESPSAAAILGVDSPEGLGAFGLGRIHPDERGAVVELFERTRAMPGSLARSTYRFQRGDGTWRHLEAISKNLLDEPTLSGVLITLRDVSQRIEAIEAAERAGKARDEFLSRMSHELRTPLHAVLGWAQLLGENEQFSVREGADQILAAGEHLLRLVDETLDLAAVQEGRITMVSEAVNVADTVSDCLDLVRPLADRRDVVLGIGDGCFDGARVRADRARLHQVLLNLLSNAVKYNRFAGEVTVRWRASGEDRWRISVRDTGPGIPEAMLSRLFERYDRIWAEDSGVEGAGLGLAIARKLLVMMGGEIGVESVAGEGCTFWIDLEAAESVRAAAA